MTVSIDELRVKLLSSKISRGKIVSLNLYDENYYPPGNADEEQVARYFLVMVAMDHRLSRPGKPYRAMIDGVELEGADLLYHLGKKRFDENPDWFSPNKLRSITKEDVLKWLSPKNDVRPPDPEIRALLLRDLGEKLIKLYGGSAEEVYRGSCNSLLRHPLSCGFLDRVRVFQAYSDPVEKKSHLLAKFLVSRGLFKPEDIHNERVPVDNHLTRIALRTGIVEVQGRFKEKLQSGICFDRMEDVLLRTVIREAWHEVAINSGLTDYELDDFLWLFGSKCCTQNEPTCLSSCRSKCRLIKGCVEECIFNNVCWSSRKKKMLSEHCFYNTYYY